MSNDSPNPFDPFDMPSPKKAESKEEIETPDKEANVVLSADASNPLVEHAQEAGVFLTKNSMEVLDKFYHRAKYGHQGAMPMRCKAEKCRFINMCPLAEAGEKLPLNKRCPVEGALVDIWAGKLITSLEIEVDNPDYAVDLDMVYELAGLELIRNRAAVHLSDNPELFNEKIVGYSPQGDPIYDDKPNLSLLILEKYGKRVDKLRDQLLATRHAQPKLGKLASDNSVRASNIKEKARKIAESRRKGDNLTDADFTVKEPEPEDES